TPGHSMLLVRLKEKGPVVLVGYAVHFHENYEHEGVPGFNYDRAQTIASIQRISRAAALLRRRNCGYAAGVQVRLPPCGDPLVQLPQVFVDALLARMGRIPGEAPDGARTGVVDRVDGARHVIGIAAL